MGHEVDWLPHVTRLLRAELPKIEFKVTSMYSPDLAAASQNGELDLGFLRVEPQPDVTYQVIAKEPIVVILPSDHLLAAEEAIDPKSLKGETLVGFSDIAILPRELVEGYLRDKGINLTPSHRVETFLDGSFARLVDPWRGAHAGLCRSAAPVVGRQPASYGREADH